jgi:hypothetical protein
MRKRGLLLSVSLAILAMALVLLIAAESQQTAAVDQESAAGTQELEPMLSLPLIVSNHNALDSSPFGVVMYASINDDVGLSEMEEAGAKWVTTQLHWKWLEPNKGSYNWTGFDTKVRNAQAADMDVFVLFTSNPSWAAALPGGPVTDTQDLVNFVSLMAERYDCDGVDDAEGQPCVHYWSFYAEPDNGDLGRALGGKGYWGHDGSGYAAMLAQVSPAIHNANPKAKVLIGGLAYDWFEEDGGPFVRDFLTDTLAALNTMGGAQAYIDAVAFHYYPISGDKWSGIAEKAREIRGIMARHGADDLPLICPEMGYWSSPTWGSSEEEQASWLVQMYAQGLSEGMQMLSWYKVFDNAIPGSPEDQYPDRTSGLLRMDWTPKPAYFAYQTMSHELRGLSYQRPLGAAGAEGYVFTLPGGGEKTVVWSQAGTVRVTFPYTHLRLVNTVGEEFDIWDSQATSPGDLDGGVVGQIELEFYENQPFYVEER